MDLLELGAVAQIVGALTIFISVVLVIIELRKNLKQNHFANSLQRAIAVSYTHLTLPTKRIV